MSSHPSKVPSIPKKAAEFMCHIKFKNSLPDPPIPCKLINVPVDLTKYTGYMPTDLEREHRYQVPSNILRTPLVDMIDLEAFKPKINEMMAVEDEPLLVSYEILERNRKMAEDRAKSATGDAVISNLPLELNASRRPDVTWLRRTEYISSESVKSSPVPAGKDDRKRKQPPKTEEILDKDGLVRIIEDGFKPFDKERLESLVHPLKQNVVAVEAIPILPINTTSSAWTGPPSFTQCNFDVDPMTSQGLGEVPIKLDADKSAILRAMSNPNDPTDSFVWYYLEKADGQDEFVYVRDYDIQRNDKSAQAYVLLQGNHMAHLVPVTSHYHLKKRRLKASENPRQPHILQVTRKAPHE